MTPDPRRARIAVAVVFALNGLLYGSFAARIPSIRDQAGVSDGGLGLALAVAAVGAIIAMPLAGTIAARRGSRTATGLSVGLHALAAVLIGQPESLAAFCAVGLVLGFATGSLDVTMNAHAVLVEQRYGRPILASFHAIFSLGGLVGSGLGALAAALALDPRIHLPLVGLTIAGVGIVALRDFLPDADDALHPTEKAFAKPPRRLLTLGGVAFACLLIEGGAGDWSGVYLRDALGATDGIAGLGFAAFSATMVAGRLTGDRLVSGFGPVAVVRTGGVIAGVGFGLALAVATPAAALVGFACLGAGMAGIVPIVFRSAGQVPGIPQQTALAAVSSVGYLGLLAGPPLLGGVAELTSVASAMTLLVALGAAVALSSPATRPRADGVRMLGARAA